jgi:hypothetical protein
MQIKKYRFVRIRSAGPVLHIEKSKKGIDVETNLSDQRAPTGDCSESGGCA